LPLTTPRLHLYPVTAADRDVLHRHWTAPDVRRYLLDDLIVDLQWVEDEIARSRNHFLHHNWGLWRLAHRDDGAFVGVCGYRDFFQPPEPQLLVSIEPSYWKQGLGSEAARRVIEYGFEKIGFDRVKACTDAPNVASQQLMERVGMTRISRELIDGLDTLCYEVKQQDYIHND
jgi:RimJ/RimL family protein N-acetyltransferase